jgi:FkbM family methyltransferase
MNISLFFSRVSCAMALGISAKQKLRLLFYMALKPSLVFRGLATFLNSRILAFSIFDASRKPVLVYVRDNGVGTTTVAEFFSPDSEIMSTKLPVLHPKVIYDLGANVGVSSLFFASLYPQATIYGFEPLPENFEVCLLNYRGIRNSSQVFPWAVGSKSGLAIFDCKNDSRGGRLESTHQDPNLETVAQIQVKIISVTDLIEKEGLPPPDLLKIDVEGAEYDVLEGLADYANSVRSIYLETHGDNLRRDCILWLEKHNFQICQGADQTAFWAWRAFA